MMHFTIIFKSSFVKLPHRQLRAGRIPMDSLLNVCTAMTAIYSSLVLQCIRPGRFQKREGAIGIVKPMAIIAPG